MGSQDVAADLDVLQSFRITHILNVASGIPNFFPEKFTYKQIEILDLPEQNIVLDLEKCFHFIDEAINSRGRGKITSSSSFQFVNSF